MKKHHRDSQGRAIRFWDIPKVARKLGHRLTIIRSDAGKIVGHMLGRPFSIGDIKPGTYHRVEYAGGLFTKENEHRYNPHSLGLAMDIYMHNSSHK